MATMDPLVLGSVVLGGVTLVVALVHLGGGTRTVELDPAHARALFADDFPDLAVTSVMVADDRRAALLDLGDRGVGLVYSLGDGYVTRALAPGVAVHDTGEGLRLRLAEVGAPGVVVRLGSPERRAAWRARLEV